MFAKLTEQVKLICISTFYKHHHTTFPSEKFCPKTWPGKPLSKATPVQQLTSSHRYTKFQYKIHNSKAKFLFTKQKWDNESFSGKFA